MNAVIQSILSNVAIIFFMHACLVELVKNEGKLSPSFVRIGRILVVSLAVISMFYLPIQYGEYRFDLRLIPLVVMAVLLGWKAVIPTLLITSLWRLSLGGEGSFPGIIFGMVLPVLAALLYKSIRQSPKLHLPSLIVLTCVAWFISDVPIIFWVPDGFMVFKQLMAIRLTTCVTTALILYVLIGRAERELQVKQTLQYYADHDPLTGLYNIRSFHKAVNSYPHTNKRKYIIMIDIDYFKAINDTYGHVAGDFVLKGVSSLIVTEVAHALGPEHATIGRYGGEEFILFLAVDEKETMISLVDAIRQKIGSASFYTEKRTHLMKVTVSIGVSQLHDGNMLQQAIEQADKSLYDSKNNGRNQTHYAEGI
ncbi:GGDEF domain-containing protein [Brevibacillus sp. GCM10020057]|uniref:GGDEF domain-containing protein n=1 Tax=Brevibacillus sp. GCM10020057 TaxID=3317327 RepID=UPI003636A452